ncbi:MAG: hypothetical protein Kow0059_18590 [Candidatus Sumerlaeia bacterium]
MTQPHSPLPPGLLELIYETVSDGVAVLNGEGRIVACNPALAMITGCPMETLIGKSAGEAWGLTERSFRGVGVTTFETRIRTATGKTRIVTGQAFQPAGEPPMRVLVMRDITRRLKLNEALHHADERWRLLWAETPLGIILAAENGDVCDMNPAARSMTGWSQGEAQRKNLSDLLQCDDSNDGRHPWDGGKPPRGETLRCAMLLRSRQGRPLDVEVVLKRLTDGHLLTVLSETPPAPTAAPPSDEWAANYHLLFQLSPSGILLEDETGIVLDANPAICRILGYRRDELIGMPVANLSAPADRDQVNAHITRILNGETLHHTVCNICKDGSTRYLELCETRVPLAGGRPAILVVANDVTEKIQAGEALRESEDRYRRIVETAQEGIWMLDTRGITTFVNHRMSELLGRDIQDIIGRHFCDFVPRDEADEAQEKFQYLLQKNAINMDFCFERPNGSFLWTIISSNPVYERDEFAGTLVMLTDITDRKRAEAQLVYDAFHDHLTGLANRALFLEHLERSLARSRAARNYLFAVLFIDFDRFKLINDSLGHAVGDQILIAAAQRLRSILRAGDLLARLGGDEFIILLDDIKEPGEAPEIARRIHTAFNEPFEAADQEIYLTASIGIAYSAASYQSADEVLRDADTAMYRAKTTGKSRHTVFQTQMRRKVQSFLRMDADLRRALQGGEFPIFYQPIINLKTGLLAGFEANVRWNHPERGLINPEEFIPLAEETGLISVLGLIVLRQASQQLVQWQQTYRAIPPFQIAVNFSAQQFHQTDLLEAVSSIILETRIDPRCLTFEITESTIMQNLERSIPVLQQLRELHIHISIDDFGTGYSSLSQLHRLPCDSLKIDQSFVRSIGTEVRKAQIVPTIIALGHNLGMSVVAEGIETPQQIWELISHDCEFGQGYYFSESVDATTAEKYLQKLDQRWF